MRVIFEISRLFALVAVFGLMAASSGCAKPEDSGSSTPSSDLGAEAGSTTGAGAEVPDVGDEGEGEGEGEGDAPAEGEGDVPAEDDAPAKTEGDAAPAEGKAAAEAAPAEAKAAAKAE
jgi:hypothetical protein